MASPSTDRTGRRARARPRGGCGPAPCRPRARAQGGGDGHSAPPRGPSLRHRTANGATRRVGATGRAAVPGV